jgi:hypothetical protein
MVDISKRPSQTTDRWQNVMLLIFFIGQKRLFSSPGSALLQGNL